MQIRIRGLYSAAHEAVRRTTHAFAAPAKGIGIDHSHVLRLRPRRDSARRRERLRTFALGSKSQGAAATGNLCCRYLDVFFI